MQLNSTNSLSSTVYPTSTFSSISLPFHDRVHKDEKNATDAATEAITKQINDSTIASLAAEIAAKSLASFLTAMDVAVIMYSIVAIIGLIGNSFVIYTIIRYSQLKTIINFCLLHLALADLIFLLTVPFLAVNLALRSWIFGRIMCKLFLSLNLTNQVTSSFLLAITAVTRYIAVCHPVSSRKQRSMRFSRWSCIGAWIAGLLLVFPNFWYAQVDPGPLGSFCQLKYPEDALISDQTLSIIHESISVFIPLMVMIQCCIMIVCKLKSRSLVRPESLNEANQWATNLVLAVIGVHIALWFPMWIVSSLQFLTGINNQSLQIFLLIYGTVTSANSSINPFLYALMSADCRKNYSLACQPLVDFIQRMRWRVVIRETNYRLGTRTDPWPSRRREATSGHGGKNHESSMEPRIAGEFFPCNKHP